MFTLGTKHKRLLARHEIDAYPSVLLYMNGDVDRPAHYIDIRDPDMMVWAVRGQGFGSCLVGGFFL
jgi:hypothetical protein